MTWQDIPGWYDWELLYEEIVSKYTGGILVEVGTYLGRSLCSLGEMVRKSGKPFQIVGVDWCVGSGPEVFPTGEVVNHHEEAVQEGLGSFAGTLHRNIREYGLSDIVSILVADSLQASRLFLDNSLTMVFIDARHDESSVTNDIEAWFPKVRAGGVIAGDDMGIEGEPPVWPGVRNAVTRLLQGFEYKPHDAWVYWKK